MSIILGIDLATSGARKIFINQHWKGFEIIKETRPDKVILSVPSQHLTFRKLKLPVVERKKIKEIIKEELSHGLLFYDDAVWDFAPIDAGEFLITIARKSDIKKLLKTKSLKSATLDAEPYSLTRACVYYGHKDALLIDFGATKTTICGIWSGKLKMCKVVLLGGGDLTRKLSDKLGISQKEADEEKKKLTADHPVINNYLEELFDTAYIRKSNYPYILISGGGSRLKSLAGWISNKFKLEVKSLETEPSMASPVALGCALKSAFPHEGVNLSIEGKTAKKTYAGWLTVGLLLLVLFSFNIKFKELYYRGRYDQINKGMNSMAIKEFPSLKTARDPLKQVKSIVKRETDAALGLENSPLDVFAGVCQSLDKRGFKFFEINYSAGYIQLIGEASSIKLVKDLREKLNSRFNGAELSEIKADPDGKINFVLKLNF